MKTPFTLNDEKMLLEEVKREPAAQMIEVGMTESGRPLTVIKVSTGGDAGERLHPTVVMYAREHADEHDTSWVVTGALRQVLSGDAAGKELRNNYNFFFIPILDLDAAARCQHETIIETFRPERPTSESKALCNFFRSWVNAGKRIDVVLNIHNLESAEGGHLSWACATDPRTFGIARSLNDSFRTELRTLGFNVPAEPGRRQELPFRFASWLSNTYGALHLPYEANSQEPTRHLTCGELQLMGGVMARRFSNFFPTSEGKNLLASVNESRQGYAARWREYGSGIQDLDALAAEQKCLWKARSEETLSQFESGKLNLDTISRQH